MLAVTMPTSCGEIFDKFSILRIKMDKFTEPTQLHNVESEYRHIKPIVEVLTSKYGSGELDCVLRDLDNVNLTIWNLIHDIGVLGVEHPDAHPLHIGVYNHNLRRSQLKRTINKLTKSNLIEEKQQ